MDRPSARLRLRVSPRARGSTVVGRQGEGRVLHGMTAADTTNGLAVAAEPGS